MKSLQKFNTILVLVLLGAAVLGPSHTTVRAGFESQTVRQEMASMFSTAFVYQGYLKQNGQPVDGYCDFDFDLYDAAINGNHIGGTQRAYPLHVVEGVFSNSLNFGDTAFNGQNRWLEIKVACPTGNPSFTSLGRQIVNAVPYAMYSLDSDKLDGLQGEDLQRRVDEACGPGYMIQSINSDGSLECERLYTFARHPLVTRGEVGEGSSIAIGNDGMGLIAFFDDTNDALKVAHCIDNACRAAYIYTLDTQLYYKYGAINITIGSDGLGLIVYWKGFVYYDLKVAHCNNIECSSAAITTIESGVTNLWADITTGGDGFGLVSYSNNNQLKVAHCTNAACSSFAIADLGTKVGAYNSIAMGLDDLGVISYKDLWSLWVAHCNNVACTSATFQDLGTGNYQYYTSIAIGGDEYPLISFYDGSAGGLNLRLAHCYNYACTSFSIYTLDSAGDVGAYNQIISSAGGYGLIVYYDTTNHDLKVARCDDDECSTATTSVLDSVGDVGQFPSIASGRDAMGLISYYDLTQANLKVIHCDDYYCEP